jgi:hypothetical protein
VEELDDQKPYLRKINKVLSTELEAQIPFLVTPVNGNHPYTHGFRVLNSKMTQATASAR